MSGHGTEYDQQAVLVKARDGYATTLAASTNVGNHTLTRDLRLKMMDIKEELRRLPST